MLQRDELDVHDLVQTLQKCWHMECGAGVSGRAGMQELPASKEQAQLCKQKARSSDSPISWACPLKQKRIRDDVQLDEMPIAETFRHSPLVKSR